MTGINIMDLLYRLPAVFIGFSFHEFAHAMAAYKMGDDTARLSGRLTLDPLAHIDPLGIIMLVLFRFGWAKPVPINPYNFKDRKKGIILVSLAGPMMNFLIAFLSFLILAVLNFKLYFSNEIVDNILFNIYIINIGLGIFNLIPLPPLDGSKILAGFLPSRLEYNFYRYEKYSYLLLLLLIFTNAIDYILGPMFFYAQRAISFFVGLFF